MTFLKCSNDIIHLPTPESQEGQMAKHEPQGLLGNVDTLYNLVMSPSLSEHAIPVIKSVLSGWAKGRLTTVFPVMVICGA